MYPRELSISPRELCALGVVPLSGELGVRGEVGVEERLAR